MSEALELYDEVSNPLDAVEDLFHSYEWNFQRKTNDEIHVDVAGQYDTYHLTLLWDEESNCLQFIAQYSFPIHQDNSHVAAEALMRMNERLWLGHFIICPKTHIAALRHTSLFRGFFHGSGAEQIEDLIDIAIKQAEQSFPVFDWLAQMITEQDNSPLDLVLMQTQGES